MDKELLRVVIILIGLLVMIGMLIWHFFKSLRERREADDYFDDPHYSGPDVFDEDEEEELDLFPGEVMVDGDGLLDDEAIKPNHKPATKPEPQKGPAKTTLPALIEFSIVARADEGFNGVDLYDAFERAGLEYGSVRVFERVDKNRLVDFAVASMVEPGTFPDSHIEQFYCPGIVFYMQPREVDKPLAVFDDFVETIDLLATELDGVVWDNQRQPLTADTVEQFRQMLARR